MNRNFWDLLSESTIFQGLITMAAMCIWAYLLVTGRSVPDTLQVVVGTVVGFFFGGKYVQAVQKAVENRDKKEEG